MDSPFIDDVPIKRMVLFPYGKSPDFTHRVLSMMNFGGFRCSFSIMGRWPNRQKTNLCMDDFACLARVMGHGPVNILGLTIKEPCVGIKDVYKITGMCSGKSTRKLFASQNFTMKIMNHNESS